MDTFDATLKMVSAATRISFYLIVNFGCSAVKNSTKGCNLVSRQHIRIHGMDGHIPNGHGGGDGPSSCDSLKEASRLSMSIAIGRGL